nr:hypothetical protein CFP56_65182 [Quercus suber]
MRKEKVGPVSILIDVDVNVDVDGGGSELCLLVPAAMPRLQSAPPRAFHHSSRLGRGHLNGARAQRQGGWSVPGHTVEPTSILAHRMGASGLNMSSSDGPPEE